MWALLAAKTTDTPVWWLFGATVGLAGVTGGLVVAAFKALRAVKVALQEIEEVRRDRHAEVFSDLGRRWVSPEMTEALIREQDFTAQRLAAFFAAPQLPVSRNPLRERLRKARARDRVVLLRVPIDFEDAAMTAKAGGLEGALVREHIGGIAVDECQVWGSAIKILQEADPLAFEEFERLVDSVRAEDAQRLGET
jgi:hypothetical protein